MLRPAISSFVIILGLVLVPRAAESSSSHWAYQTLDAGSVPDVREQAWCRNLVDRFVLARLEQAGIEPSPTAKRYKLIRRLYYDLIGLPPAIEEVDQFAGDTAPDAYQRLVDRLLASPHFGERWGRHWLDKARYADTNGYSNDEVRPEMWRYRDWVIQELNRDLPFDQFSIEQIAGDLLPNANDRQRLATAFHRQTPTNTESGVNQEGLRVVKVMDRVETLGTVWLGLTLSCARCHAHKYDQISQQEYYQLLAFFNNCDEADITLRPDDGSQEEVTMQLVAQRTADPRTTYRLHRGDFLQPTEVAEPGVLAVLPSLDRRNPEQPADRLDLSRWLVGPAQQLTARVAANQIWLHLFGGGLVHSASDFGVRGDLPTHPRLLDWLAKELIEGSWSRKSLIRTIVNSATYRQDSSYRPELAARDAQNKLLHRQRRIRVEAEIVRDLHLAVGGLLSLKPGGPSVFSPLPENVLAELNSQRFEWKVAEGEDRYRRGIYTFYKRRVPYPSLVAFDCPSAMTANVRREISNTPLQALALLNDQVFVAASRGLAIRLLTEGPADDAGRLTRALRLCVARPPRVEEVDLFGQLLQSARDYFREAPADAESLCVNSPPGSIPADEAAAWIVTVQMIMNLDEFITRE